MNDVTTELDARGLNCPLPILKTRKAINDLEAGEVLKVVSTDPGSVKDFPAFARQTGHQVIETGETDGEYIFLLQKSELAREEE